MVVALRHLAPQGEELAALGHLHEDTPHTERTELVRDRAIRAAATSCYFRHRVTLPRVGLTVKSEAARVASIASSDGGMSVSTFPMLAVRLDAHVALLPLPRCERADTWLVVSSRCAQVRAWPRDTGARDRRLHGGGTVRA